MALALAGIAAGEATDVYHLREMHHHPWFLEVMLASLVGWILGLVKGFSGTKDWIERYWAAPPTVLLFFVDFLIFVCVGAYLGTGIFRPSEFLQAMAAGLTWPVGLGALATRTS